jgi:CRP/FNR family transcriptional regulator, cyclic AMP receptor protein
MTEDFLGLFNSDPNVVSLKPGQEPFKKGDLGRHMYVVKSGDVQAVDGNHVFETVSPGGIVGEMALVNEEPRTATVRALSASEVIPVDQKRFLYLVQVTPFLPFGSCG